MTMPAGPAGSSLPSLRQQIAYRVANGVPKRMDGPFASKGLTLPERLYAKIDREAGAVHPTLGSKCHVWTGGATTGGRRAVAYGIINEGSLEGGSWRKTWRVHLLALLLKTGFDDTPEIEGELFIPWLYRAKRFYTEQGLEASHQCDVSLCCNPDHLLWESHADNLFGQKWRAGWRPEGWIPQHVSADYPDIRGE